jgi:DNA invertase Pin-like site-specific DNA recombinase
MSGVRPLSVAFRPVEPAHRDLLAAEPEDTSGEVVGYGRGSTSMPSDAGDPEEQRAALLAAGCTRLFVDASSGKGGAARPEFDACMGSLEPGDVLVVVRLDRLTRSLPHLVGLVGELRTRGVGFRSLHEGLDTTTPGGRLVFHVFAALAEFLRELLVEGTRDGLAAARARGQRLGRPPALSPDQVSQARSMLARPENSVASIARLLGVSRSTLYKHVPELGGRQVVPPASEPAPTPGD